MRGSDVAFEYISSFEDYRAAQKLYLRHRKDARVRLLAWMIGVPIFTVVCFSLGLWERSSANPGFYIMTMGLAGAGLAMTISAVVLRPWNLRRSYRKSRKASGLEVENKIAFSFDEEGVTSTVIGRSEGRFFWNAINDYVEDDAIALIFIGKKRFLYIPKRALDEEDWQDLRTAIRDLAPGASC
jgi:hypothetical protein